MKPEIKRVVIVTHAEPAVASATLRQSLAILAVKGVEVVALGAEWDKHAKILREAGGASSVSTLSDLEGVGLCLALGGDGTMLRALNLTRGLGIPVAGVNLGRVGFLTTMSRDLVEEDLSRLLAGEFVEYPLLGLEADTGREIYRATNDVVVNKGDRSHACSLALTINGVTLFEVLCDGIVVGTPAGSSAYSLAAGGPLLGISVDAYVITPLAPHAVGIRPVVAAPEDVLEVINTDSVGCSIDVDGERLGELSPDEVVQIKTIPGMNSLALLEGDNLYHHFRDRLL